MHEDVFEKDVGLRVDVGGFPPLHVGDRSEHRRSIDNDWLFIDRSIGPRGPASVAGVTNLGSFSGCGDGDVERRIVKASVDAELGVINWLEFAIDGHAMGTVAEPGTPGEVRVQVAGTAPLLCVELVKNGAVVASHQPPLARRELHWGFKVLVDHIDEMWFAPGKNDFSVAPNFSLRALKELHIEFKATGD